MTTAPSAPPTAGDALCYHLELPKVFLQRHAITMLPLKPAGPGSSASIAGHALKLLILEPGDGALDIEALRGAVGERLDSAPRATHRVDTCGPEPRWVPAEAFDIRQHVRRHSDPECDSKADLWRIVGGLMSEHLDRSRPLWTFDVIGPLADGREAIAARIQSEGSTPAASQCAVS